MNYTFEDIVRALMEDSEWEVPAEDREMMLMGLNWTLLDL